MNLTSLPQNWNLRCLKMTPFLEQCGGYLQVRLKFSLIVSAGVVHTPLVVGKLPYDLVVPVAVAILSVQVSLWCHQVLVPAPYGQEGDVLLIVLVDGDGVVAFLGVKADLPAFGRDAAGREVSPHMSAEGMPYRGVLGPPSVSPCRSASWRSPFCVQILVDWGVWW